MCSRAIATLIILAMALPAVADHDCVESLPSARKIETAHHFPKRWFLVGTETLNDSSFDEHLKRSYSSYYVNNSYGGLVCLKDENGYVTISTDTEYGPWASYSVKQPACFKCQPYKNALTELSSGIGIYLGQTKSEVSQTLGISLPEDIMDIEFNETQKAVLHTESLSLEFKNGILVRFGVGDYREGT